MRTSPRSLRGTHLFLKRGIYCWRRVNRVTGERVRRSTETRDLAQALRIAATFEEDLKRSEAGLPDLQSWKKPLSPLAESYLSSFEGELTEKQVRLKRCRLNRALADATLRRRRT